MWEWGEGNVIFHFAIPKETFDKYSKHSSIIVINDANFVPYHSYRLLKSINITTENSSRIIYVIISISMEHIKSFQLLRDDQIVRYSYY